MCLVLTRAGGKSRPDHSRPPRRGVRRPGPAQGRPDDRPHQDRRRAGGADTPTVADLAQRYLVEHVEVRCKPRTIASERWLVRKFVLPELGKLTIDEVERKHIAALHYRHRDTPYQASQILEVVRKMFNLAEAWGLHTDGGNPCRFVLTFEATRHVETHGSNTTQ